MFTLNNPHDSGPEFETKLKAIPCLRYYCFQREIGADTGTVHYQGYIELTRTQRFSYLHSRLDAGLWLQARRGTPQEASDYAKKLETRDPSPGAGPFEHGTISEGSGSRTDLASMIDTVRSTGSVTAAARIHPETAVRYPRGLELLARTFRGHREVVPQVILLFGATGCGKTRFVMDRYDYGTYLRKAPDTRWFDGYERQPVLLLDDFSGASSKMSLNYVLQLIDRYPVDVEIKGGYVPLLCSHIFITTNNHPESWYDYSSRNEQYKALARRIHHVILFEEDDDGNHEPYLCQKDLFFQNWQPMADPEIWARRSTQTISSLALDVDAS